MKKSLGRCLWGALATMTIIAGCNNNPAPAAAGETTGSATTGTTGQPAPVEVSSDLKHDGFRYMGLERKGDLTYEYSPMEGTPGSPGTEAVETLGATPEKATFKFTRGGALSIMGSETYEVRKDGVYLTVMELGELKEPMLALPADVKVGSKWTSVLTTKPGSKKNFQFSIDNVAEKEEEIKVKGGTFKALLVSGKGTMTADGETKTMLYKTWYSKDVGTILLRIEVRKPDGTSSKNSLELAKPKTAPAAAPPVAN